MGENIKKPIFSIKKVINQKKWSKDEDSILLNLVKENNGKKWKEIASHFHNKNPLQCFSRYKRIRPEINKGSWKKEEDSLILNLIEIYGNSWSKISKIIKTRNGKQIRDRYTNVLAPNINKNKFSPEEDILLLNLYQKFGPKWSKIHTYFKDRTTDMIKNRFHSTLKKKFKYCINNNNIINNNNKNKNEDNLIINENNNNNNNNNDVNNLNTSELNKINDNININNNNNNNNIKNNNVNNNNIIKGNSSTESSTSNNKDFSTIIKLSYPPSSLSNKLEKEERNNIEQNNNNIFNNEYFEYFFGDDNYIH